MTMKHMRDPVEIGKTLHSLRGIRIRTGVAKELGISYSMLSKIEDGLRTPGEELMIRIANYYGKTVDEIFYTHK
jgi:transcriptional regulator with XRE-family HTH domain